MSIVAKNGREWAVVFEIHVERNLSFSTIPISDDNKITGLSLKMPIFADFLDASMRGGEFILPLVLSFAPNDWPILQTQNLRQEIFPPYAEETPDEVDWFPLLSKSTAFDFV